MINFDIVVNEFKKLGFDYDLFGADAGYRDIFTNHATGDKIIFYDELDDNDQHHYLCKTKDNLINMDLHIAINMYTLVKWGWY
jgi:hypothetical protein